MADIVIVVKGGMVQEVFSSDRSVDVTVMDLDTEEGLELEKELELPPHQVF